MRKEFLRSPVDFARISSHFNLRRKHPILHTIRAHKGTDYAASRGTPVRATGDGKVIHASRKGGYGKTVIIQHGQTYKTLYAHLNGYARGVRSGKSVKQGQVIGYVGSTGLATGPHLHYEFYVHGAVRNPVTVKLPKANSINSGEMNRFLAATDHYTLQLASFTGGPTLSALPASSKQ
jgi:murein DD-endopeptidase MepM/ murein hydrolase activator NlpD